MRNADNEPNRADGGLPSPPANAIEKALRARERQQAAVAWLGQFALTPVDLGVLMDKAVTLVAEALSVEYAKVLELLPDGKALLLRAGVGWHERLVGLATVGSGADSQAGYTLLSDEPVIVADLRTETRFSGPPLLYDHGVVSGLSVIVGGRERPFGVLSAHTARRRAFSQDDGNFLQAVANVLAAAIDRGRADEQIHRQEEQVGERRRVEQQLRLHASALEAAANAIVITDQNGTIKWVNPAFTALTGYSAAEAIGQNPRVLKSGQQSDDVYRGLWETIAGGQVWHDEIINRRKDGSFYTEEMTITPVRDAEGEVANFIAIKQDVTARKQAEESIQALNQDLQRQAAELAAANRELEAFSYSVSHDLRAPLRAMAGFSHILIEEHASELGPKARHYLGLVHENARHMGELIDHLLSFSRLSRQPLARKEVQPAEIVRQVLADLAAEQAGRRVEVTIGDLPPCHADPTLLKQVFVNLLGNALKFTHRREVAVVEVGCQHEAGERVYFVKDNGAGFDMRYVDKLFGVFQRLHRADEYDGTGVGLAIVQRIIHRHGGRVWAEGAVDRGATFYFTI